MNNNNNILLIIFIILYIISPIDILPGPIDDLIIFFIGFTTALAGISD